MFLPFISGASQLPTKNTGHHTVAKRLIIDFYAGLCRYHGYFSYRMAEIPDDVQKHIEEYWGLL